MNLTELIHKTSLLYTQYEYTKTRSTRIQHLLTILEDSTSLLLEAQTILKETALITQNQLSYELSTVSTASLEAIFPIPYSFSISFLEKRNKTEIDYNLHTKEMSLGNPIQSVGGGVNDILSFSLRIACLLISNTEKILVLDEPMKNLSRNLQPLAGTLLKKLSDDLDIQFIIVSHDTTLIEELDANIITVQ